MKMHHSVARLVLVITISAVSLCAQRPGSCTPPSAAVAKVRAYLAYQNGRDGSTNKRMVEHLSVLTIGNRVFLRTSSVPENFVTGSKIVYVYQPTRGLGVMTCPEDSWVACASEWNRNPDAGGTFADTRQRTASPTGAPCDFDLDVPEWMPSPETPQKKQLAAEILSEIVGNNLKYREVYVRDFNIDDPNIDIYMVNEKGESEFQGCDFDRTQRPHCGWHMYGMTPRDWLKQNVMERPYRLYPPPIGKP